MVYLYFLLPLSLFLIIVVIVIIIMCLSHLCFWYCIIHVFRDHLSNSDETWARTQWLLRECTITEAQSAQESADNGGKEDLIRRAKSMKVNSNYVIPRLKLEFENGSRVQEGVLIRSI